MVENSPNDKTRDGSAKKCIGYNGAKIPEEVSLEEEQKKEKKENKLKEGKGRWGEVKLWWPWGSKRNKVSEDIEQKRLNGFSEVFY